MRISVRTLPHALLIAASLSVFACRGVDGGGGAVAANNAANAGRDNTQSQPTVSAGQKPVQSQATPTSETQNPGGTQKCQPATVPRTPGLSPQFDMNDVEEAPGDVDGMNELLHNVVGDFEFEKGYDVLGWAGDYNGDGCGDIAIVVRHTDKYHNVNSLAEAAGNTAVDVTIRNLRTGATLSPADDAGRKAGLPAALKPREPVGLVIFHGAPEGKVWAHGGAGRTFLLLDSVYEPYDKSGRENQLALLRRVRRNAHERKEEIPAEAKGDALLAGRSYKFADNRSHFNGRRVIYFDGANYIARSLPDSVEDIN